MDWHDLVSFVKIRPKPSTRSKLKKKATALKPNYELIADDEAFDKLIKELETADFIGFDTEFVSEDCYRPDLCLLQIATRDQFWIVDTKSISDAKRFWEVLVEGDHETVVHAGREELRFCLQATGKSPRNMVDIQIAAGFVGLEYPAAYSTLVSKLLGISLSKGETRTDWRRRPLTNRQLDYALQDVVYLASIRDVLLKKLEKLGRSAWLTDEIQNWQTDIEQYETQKRWRRVGGISGLSRRGLAIVRELWIWREKEGERRNRTPRRILRDDLIVELARRETSDSVRIQSVRGFERRELKRHIGEICDCVQRGLDLPEDQLPKKSNYQSTPQLNLVGQFLTAAVGSLCRDASIAPAIVGTTQEIRELVSFRLGLRGNHGQEPPELAKGWRGELIGESINDLLAGRAGLRIDDPMSDQPLTIWKIN